MFEAARALWTEEPEAADPRFDRADPRSLEDATYRIRGNFQDLSERACWIGQDLAWAKKEVGHTRWGQWLRDNLPEFGIKSERTAQRYAKHRKECIPYHKEGRHKPFAVKSATMADSDECYTPKIVIDPARAVLGGFDLDPASCAKANEVVGAKQIHTKDEDGLTYPWRGKVWLNPPYLSQTRDFILKICAEYQAGNVDGAIVLLGAQHLTRPWFQALLEANAAICMTKARLPFWNPDLPTKKKDFITQTTSVLACLGDKYRQRFIEEFTTVPSARPEEDGGGIGRVVNLQIRWLDLLPGGDVSDLPEDEIRSIERAEGSIPRRCTFHKDPSRLCPFLADPDDRPGLCRYCAKRAEREGMEKAS